LESLSRSPQACIFLLDRLVHHRSRLLHSFRVLPSLSFILDESQVSAYGFLHSILTVAKNNSTPFCSVLSLHYVLWPVPVYLFVIAERCSGLSPPRIRRARKFNFNTINLVQRWW
jgi:hypothetical protein